MKSKKSSKKSAVKASQKSAVKAVKGRTVGACKFPASQQCEHKTAKHHSRGKCVSCYNRARNSKPKKAVKKSVKKAA